MSTSVDALCVGTNWGGCAQFEQCQELWAVHLDHIQEGWYAWLQLMPNDNWTICMCCADVWLGPSRMWQALVYAAIAISILFSVVAKQVAARDIKKELQRVRQTTSLVDKDSNAG
jgi:hypothetical protein